MKLLLTYLLLASLCALLSRGVSSKLVVTQSEDVTVEGDTAEISCCWTEGHERPRVTWTKNEKIVIPERIENKSCSLLKLANITKADEGTYFCIVKVEIPILVKASGNGTVLTVKYKHGTENETTSSTKDGSRNNATFYTLIALAVLAPVLLVTLIWFCCLRRKRDQAARVIYEAPHFDSEMQEMDKHSTGSRGSSQWCQVPVYESFDYFEHTEAKKSG